MTTTSNVVSPSDLKVNDWITLFGPNLKAIDPESFQPEHFSNDSEGIPHVCLEGNPNLQKFSGVPLSISAVNLPFILVRVPAAHQNNFVGSFIIDTRVFVVSPLSSDYVSAFLSPLPPLPSLTPSLIAPRPPSSGLLG